MDSNLQLPFEVEDFASCGLYLSQRVLISPAELKRRTTWIFTNEGMDFHQHASTICNWTNWTNTVGPHIFNTFSCSETHIAKNPSRPGYEPKIKMGQEVTILNAPKHHGIHSMTGEFWAGVTSPQELQPFINRPKSSMVLSGFMANGQEFYSFSHVKAWFLEDQHNSTISLHKSVVLPCPSCKAVARLYSSFLQDGSPWFGCHPQGSTI